MNILAIDPGNTESAYALIDKDHFPIVFGKVPNDEMRDLLQYSPPMWNYSLVAIEMIASFGMPVGKEVFETCVWTGRFLEVAYPTNTQLVYRQAVKLHHCHSVKAKDSNVTQALVDRFAPGQSNKGKGTKANPGWFYGFAKDIWQAYALAVYVADTQAAERGVRP